MRRSRPRRCSVLPHATAPPRQDKQIKQRKGDEAQPGATADLYTVRRRVHSSKRQSRPMRRHATSATSDIYYSWLDRRTQWLLGHPGTWAGYMLTGLIGLSSYYMAQHARVTSQEDRRHQDLAPARLITSSAQSPSDRSIYGIVFLEKKKSFSFFGLLDSPMCLQDRFPCRAARQGEVSYISETTRRGATRIVWVASMRLRATRFSLHDRPCHIL